MNNNWRIAIQGVYDDMNMLLDLVGQADTTVSTIKAKLVGLKDSWFELANQREFAEDWVERHEWWFARDKVGICFHQFCHGFCWDIRFLSTSMSDRFIPTSYNIYSRIFSRRTQSWQNNSGKQMKVWSDVGWRE